ncbi:MAG: TetR/AcrR family transcriptional regulator [Gammaproteobacteria bacterium]|nr:TetR/AcrR family transcriptional regulator [Gammaproteobacteria bacterium]
MNVSLTHESPWAARSENAGTRQRKTEKILDAALQAFLEAGYGAVSMDVIAARAGVSKATVYTRFPSKQALFAAVITRECEACTQRMTLAETAPAPDLASALHRIAETLLDIITLPQNLAIQRLVIAEGPRFPELGTMFYEYGPAVTLRNLAAFLQRERTRGELQILDATAAAQQFISLLRGDIQIRALLGAGDLSKTARKRVADHAVKAFLQLYADAR